MLKKFAFALAAASLLASTALAQTSDAPALPEGLDIPPEIAAMMSPEDIAKITAAMDAAKAQVAGMGLEMPQASDDGFDFQGMVTPSSPDGCPLEDDPAYTPSSSGEGCDISAYRIFLLGQVDRLRVALRGGEYAQRPYEYTRDCTLASGVMTVAPMIEVDEFRGIRLNSYADRQRGFWSRLLDVERDGRSAQQIVEDLERGDTRFAKLIVAPAMSDDGINMSAIGVFYNQCLQMSDRLGGPVKSADE